MTKRFALTIAAAMFAAVAHAQNFGGGPVTLGPLDHNDAQIDTALRAGVATAQSLGIIRPDTPQIGSTGNLQFPLRLRPGSKAFRGNGISNFVDLNSTAAIKDFACGTRSYDGHRGIDFSLYPHLWPMMDAGEVEIVAAAPGVIINKDDGQFDRQCQWGGNPPANFVTILQDDGLYAFYWHMKKNSVTTRLIGTRVAAGDVLGLVGSSGFSTGPHLHFELRTQAGVTVDPFAGACRSGATRWKHQPENIDTDILRIATHSATPTAPWAGCTPTTPKYSDKFAPGAQVWGAVYLRDQTPTTPVTIQIVRPNGQILSSWTSGAIGQTYSFSWWWITATLPASGANGTWKVRATIEGRSMEHAFVVGTLPAATTIQIAASPAARTTTPGGSTFFDVTVKNVGTRTATGCTLAPDAPLAAAWEARQIVPTTPASEINRVFELAAGATKKIRLTIKPKAGYKANAIKIPIRVACLNANSPATASTNTVTLTF